MMHKLSNKNWCYTNSAATTICASARFRHSLPQLTMFANLLTSTFCHKLTILQWDKRNEDVGSCHRAEKKKGTTNVFICLHMGDNFNYSCKLLHHCNEMASNLPENTKLAFNQVIKLYKFVVKLLEGWKFSFPFLFCSIFLFCFPWRQTWKAAFWKENCTFLYVF